MQKRSLTLLEILLAFSLTAIIVSCLIAFLTSSTKFKARMELQKKEVYSYHFFYHKLSELFNHIVDPEEGGSFYTEEDSLFFTYDAGPQKNSFFSGVMLASLSVSKDHDLILTFASKKHPKKTKVKTLLRNVSHISFDFPEQKKDFWEKSQSQYPEDFILVIHPEKSSLTHTKNAEQKSLQEIAFPFVIRLSPYGLDYSIKDPSKGTNN